MVKKANNTVSIVNFRLKTALLSVLIIGAVGTALLIRSFAATGDVISIQPESGTPSGSVVFTDDETVSGGSYVTLHAPVELPIYPVITGTAKIMPLGDSITSGVNSQYPATYRYNLQDKLRASQCRYDFVGSQIGLAFREAPAGYDQEHEGHGGLSSDGNFYTNKVFQRSIDIPGKISQYQPDIVLLHLGTNDTADSIPVTTITSRLSATLDDIRAQKNNIIILIAKIIPAALTHENGGYPPLPSDHNARTEQLNTQIAQLVEQKSTATAPIVVVDMYTSYNADANNFDSLHPNETGSAEMADRWWPILKQILDASALCTKEN